MFDNFWQQGVENLQKLVIKVTTHEENTEFDGSCRYSQALCSGVSIAKKRFRCSRERTVQSLRLKNGRPGDEYNSSQYRPIRPGMLLAQPLPLRDVRAPVARADGCAVQMRPAGRRRCSRRRTRRPPPELKKEEGERKADRWNSNLWLIRIPSNFYQNSCTFAGIH